MSLLNKFLEAVGAADNSEETYVKATAFAANGDLKSLKAIYPSVKRSLMEAATEGGGPRGYMSPILEALSNGKKECADYLFAQNCPLHSELLSFAIKKADPVTLKYLLEKGVDINGDIFPRTAQCDGLLGDLFGNWCHSKNETAEQAAECFKLMVQYGYDVNKPRHKDDIISLNIYATEGESYERLKPCVDYVLANLKDDANLVSRFAEYKNNRDKRYVQQLAEKCQVANIADQLSYLAANGYVDTVKYIVQEIEKSGQKYADLYPDEISKAIIGAAQNGEVATLKFLCGLRSAQPDLNEALGAAAHAKMPEAVSFLLSEGADVNYVYTYRQFHYQADRWDQKEASVPVIAVSNDPEVVACMAKAGANPDVLNWEGRPVLTVMIGTENANNAVREIIKAGANLEIMDIYARRPLENAVIYENADALKMLLAAGAKFIDDGISLAKAKELGNEEIIHIIEACYRGEVPTRQEAGLESFWEERLKIKIASQEKPTGKSDESFRGFV